MGAKMKEPKTLGELYFYIQGEFDAIKIEIESCRKEIKESRWRSILVSVIISSIFAMSISVAIQNFSQNQNTETNVKVEQKVDK